MDTVFHRGMCFVHHSTWSVTSLREGAGGTIHSFWAMNSLNMSFWEVPPTREGSTPCFSATATSMATRMMEGQLMVMEVVTLSRGMPEKTVSMSSRVSTATPSLPTSPRLYGLSLS